MKQKAFTLIELLVVVAIIGILAAVGVVAYNGYTSAAKINATKTIHSQVVKYISAEILKCSIGESKFMGKNQDCPATAAKAVKGTVATITDKNPFDSTDIAFKGDFDIPTIKGRTNCNWSDVRGAFTCYSRWGSGANDYETSYINQL